MHLYQVRRREDRHGVDLISDALSFGRLWYDGRMRSRMQPATRCTTPDPANAMICVYDEAGKVIKTYEYNGDFKEW
jgi:hypothetical protein